MAKHQGKNGTVYIGSGVGTIMGEVESFSINEDADTIQGVAMGDSAIEQRVTFARANGSITCFWDPADTNGQNLFTAGAELFLELGPIGSDSGDTVKELTVLVQSIQTATDVNGWVKTTFNFVGKDGVVTTRVVTS